PYSSLGPIYHCDPISRSYDRIGCTRVNVSCATRSHYGDPALNPLHFTRFTVQRVNAETGDIFRTLIHKHPQVMLSNQIDRKIMRQYLYIRVLMNTFEQRPFYFVSCNILIMQHSVLGMAAFLGQIIITFTGLIEMGSIVNNLLYPL